MSPFYSLYLRDPCFPLDQAFTSIQDCKVQAVEDQLRNRRAVDDLIKHQIEQANRYQVRYQNRHRRDLNFAVGDQVLLSSQNLPLPVGLSRKLASKWIGPLTILKAVGNVAYRVQLPGKLERLHDVFHVSLLKPFLGDSPPLVDPVFVVDGHEEFEVEAILGHRKSRSSRQFLIKWKGYDTFENTWEPQSNLNCGELLDAYMA